MALTKNNEALEAILFGLFVFLVECFGGIYIGPLSPRQYLIILAAIYMLFHYKYIVKDKFKPAKILFAYFIYSSMYMLILNS